MMRGIRGATTVRSNTSSDILSATRQLLEVMIRDNGLEAEGIASIFFSVTSDLDADFPAKSARELGLTNVALLCMTEIDVPGSLRLCIRVLIHANTEVSASEICHVYLNGAVALRPDRGQYVL
jgi:chorismate mutase